MNGQRGPAYVRRQMRFERGVYARLRRLTKTTRRSIQGEVDVAIERHLEAEEKGR